MSFVVGLVLGVSVTALLFIVVGPSRRVRAEQPLSEDDETRILMGYRPKVAPDEPSSSPAPVILPREYDTGEMQALRRLGSPPGRRRSRN